MSLKDWIVSLSGKASDGKIELDINCLNLSEQVAIKNLAINSAINLIGNSIALSEFNTYKRGKLKKENDYYALNVEPNINYSATAFWKKAMYKLAFDNECLIIKSDKGYHVADSFTKTKRAFKSNYFRDIVVDDFQMKIGYEEKDVLYFNLNQNEIRRVIESLYLDYGKLVEYSKASYKKNNAKRGILNIPTNYPNTKEAQEKLSKILNEQISQFYSAENGAVLPLTNGITYQDISSDSYKNATDSRDIKNLIDDIFDFTAVAFQIPPAILKGTTDDLENSVDRYIKFCIEPICEIIEDECNRKIYSKEDYLSGTHLSIDTTKLKTTNLTSLATVIDVLSRNGVHSIDENRELIGKEPLGTKASQERRITKNYEKFDEI